MRFVFSRRFYFLLAVGLVPLSLSWGMPWLRTFVVVYDILLVLEESPDQRLRMSELAELALISRSGITRLVDRLEKDGLVKRASCSHDRRAIHALLTEKGLKERERAWPIYEEALEELFASKLNDAEAKTLAKLLRRYTPKDHPLTCVGLD